MGIIGILQVTLVISSLITYSAAAFSDDTSTTGSLDNNTLAICVHPYKPPAQLYRSFSPLAEYLSQKIRRPITIHIASNYEAHIKNVGGNSLCIGYMGPGSYVMLVKKYGQKRILARQAVDGIPVFHGKIIARKDSSINSLADLVGKRFAFGDPDSTMSHLVPHYMLIKAGVTDEKLKSYKFVGNHDNVALGVLMGNFDAGAVKEEVFYKYEKRGLKAIATTPACSEHLFVASDGISQPLVKQLRKTLLEASQTQQGLRALHAIKNTISAFVPAKDTDYDNIRKVMATLKSHGEIK